MRRTALRVFGLCCRPALQECVAAECRGGAQQTRAQVALTLACQALRNIAANRIDRAAVQAFGIHQIVPSSPALTGLSRPQSPAQHPCFAVSSYERDCKA